MTYSRAYDAYTENPNFLDSQSSRLPVAGTVARGHGLPDHLVEGDTNAYKAFTTTAKFTDLELKEGGRLYNIYCAICHGTDMDGNGPIYKNGKFAAKPAALKDAAYLGMPSGQIYAAIKYGKNAMGSYASQLDIKQRWQIIAYIKKFQSENGGAAFTMGINGPAADTTRATAGADTTAAAAANAAASPNVVNEKASGAAH
jgi:cytochrome c